MLKRLFCIVGFFTLFSCSIFSSIATGVSFQKYTLRNYGATLFVPADWKTQKDTFYQLESEGSLKEYQHLRFEYRGLSTRLRGLHEKQQYARGWYDAFLLSYKKHKARFIERSRDRDDPEGSFLFVGEYEDENLGSMVRFGILRFRGNRLHTLYYTAPKKGFEKILALFLRMEKMHRYFPP